MTTQEKIAWITKNAGKVFNGTPSRFSWTGTTTFNKYTLTGRLLGYYPYNSFRAIIENKETSLLSHIGYNKYPYILPYTDRAGAVWFILDAETHCGDSFDISELVLAPNYKTNSQLKNEEIKRLESKLELCWDANTIELIEARIEELELSKDEPYIVREINALGLNT